VPKGERDDIVRGGESISAPEATGTSDAATPAPFVTAVLTGPSEVALLLADRSGAVRMATECFGQPHLQHPRATGSSLGGPPPVLAD
jgi:hypothetical protein